MKENKGFKRLMIFAIATTMFLSALAMLPSASADSTFINTAITPMNRGEIPDYTGSMEPLGLSNALVAGADYLVHAQADITEDNAGNGLDGSETPEDPDDGGWDWVLASPTFTHSAVASSTNLFGVTALGLYYAYLETLDASYMTAMNDVVFQMNIDPTIDSAPDMIFLMLYDDLVGSPGTWAALAKTKYDAKLLAVPLPHTTDATGLAQYIRDVRGVSQPYPNGIIAWDVGAFARVAAMLDVDFPVMGYDIDADNIAEVLYQDSFMGNPGLFDYGPPPLGDGGWDPTKTDKNFWWYTLGITFLDY